MPASKGKTSKTEKTSSKPKGAAPLREEPAFFDCCRCERRYKRQKGNFPASQSNLFRANGSYLPICNNCVDELYVQYKESLGSDKAAIRRVCSKFDIYWNEEIYNMLLKSSTSSSRMRAYISKNNLYRFIGKTYDDTLDEEAEIQKALDEKAAEEELKRASNPIVESPDDALEVEEIATDAFSDVTPEMIEFWGAGLPASMYSRLNKRYNWWMSNKDDDISEDRGAQALYRQICILEVTINDEKAAGKPVDKYINTLNTCLGSVNAKPVQKKSDVDTGTAIDDVPFGVGIKYFEDKRPIPDPDPEFEDVDGIRKYINVWLLGHLCKMLKISNSYSRAYDEEISKYTAEKPEYEDEESLYDNIFNDDTGDN